MDMRKYSGGLITPENLREGPQVEKTVNIYENEKHGCAVLQFESGNEFFCWNNYARVLNKAWGYDSENWLEQELELSLGHYKDRKTGEQKETVDIRPISPAKPGAFDKLPAKPVAPGGGGSRGADLDDGIPF